MTWELKAFRKATIRKPRFRVLKKGRQVATLAVEFDKTGDPAKAELKINPSASCEMSPKGLEDSIRRLWLRTANEAMDPLIPVEQLPPVDISDQVGKLLPDVPIPRHVANFYQDDDQVEDEPGEDYLIGGPDLERPDLNGELVECPKCHHHTRAGLPKCQYCSFGATDMSTPIIDKIGPPNDPERMNIPERHLSDREVAALKFTWEQGGECHVAAFKVKDFGLHLLARLAGEGYFDMLDDPPRLSLTIKGTKAVAAETPLQVQP